MDGPKGELAIHLALSLCELPEADLSSFTDGRLAVSFCWFWYVRFVVGGF